MQGGFDFIAAACQSIGKELGAFRTGTGLAWGRPPPCPVRGHRALLPVKYRAHLVREQIPVMDGVHEKLAAGAGVADIGCGYGSSTVVTASAYPDPAFTGCDYHEPSVQAARESARRAGVDDRVSFQAVGAAGIRGPYGLIAFFDCWHDTGDPLGVAAAARGALADDGSVLLAEPFAGDRLEGNVNPLGRMRYGASAIACTPLLDQRRRPRLGAGRRGPHPASCSPARGSAPSVGSRKPNEHFLPSPPLTVSGHAGIAAIPQRRERHGFQLAHAAVLR